MRPFLQTGDLVLLHNVNPSTLKTGQVIAVAVNKNDQIKYGLPGEIVHRIIGINHTAGGLTFQTKGDANSGPDVFITYAPDVVGVMTGSIPDLGYPIIFFRSRQGEIFAGVAAFVIVTYFVLGWLDRRRTSDPVVGLLESVITDLAEIRSTLDPGIDEVKAYLRAAPSTRQALAQQNSQQLAEHSVAPPYATSNDLATRTPPTISRPFEDQIMIEDEGKTTLLSEESFKGFASAVGASVEMASNTNESVKELLEAMREYAEHLRSHTAAVQGMSLASMDLARVAADIRNFISNATEGSSRAAITPQLREIPSVSHAAQSQNLAAATVELHRATSNFRPVTAVPPLAASATDTDTVLDPSSFLPPELLAQRDSLMSTTARVDSLLHELSKRWATAE